MVMQRPLACKFLQVNKSPEIENRDNRLICNDRGFYSPDLKQNIAFLSHIALIDIEILAVCKIFVT